MQTYFWYLPKLREQEITYSFSLVNPCEDSTNSNIMTENKVVHRMLEASSWQFKSSLKVSFFSYYHCSFVNFEICHTYFIMRIKGRKQI